MARQLSGYSRICFPQCEFEVPNTDEHGYATIAIDLQMVLLKVKREDAQKVGFGNLQVSKCHLFILQVRTISLKWSSILGYSVLSERHEFHLKFMRGDTEREVNLISMFSEFLYEVFDLINAERQTRAMIMENLEETNE